MSSENYFRPIQYLGAKTRTLGVIASECKRLYRDNTYVVDLFSGSSIVSQALFYNGMAVISNDALRFCSDILFYLNGFVVNHAFDLFVV